MPGKKSPVLVTAEMVAMMAPGSVIVDLAALGGGNCELTRANEVVVAHGVTVLGPTNLPSTVPNHASQMYARNVVTFLTHLIKDGSLRTDIADDEIAIGIIRPRPDPVAYAASMPNALIDMVLGPTHDHRLNGWR